ncbi:two-component response regulator [Planococcus sp. PAMC 21323]|uniref:response regulator transcription factor n=1 Tax=Planococcus sp. PAMC 21323 TaxID=1526927 RepID=UPI00056DBA34|nr:response regulator transcription factor [Planococcus sp. PAMC 21323]AIY04457.1 two-component response regulator [Planococcus sp. PAMC 21323]
MLVDDEKRMLDLVALYLKPHNYVCTKADNGKQALELLKKESFDLVLLDIMMPDMDGWEVCRDIRKFSDVPIIMLTAREQQEDVVKGLRLGADDYMTKPFGEDELLARMEALLRRSAPTKRVEFKGLLWNEESFELTYEQKSIRLTPKEFSMLGLLLKNPNKVFERDRLLELIWGFDSETEGRTVDSHVRNIREKVRQAGFPVDDHFLTVWGIGYKWVH